MIYNPMIMKLEVYVEPIKPDATLAKANVDAVYSIGKATIGFGTDSQYAESLSELAARITKAGKDSLSKMNNMIQLDTDSIFKTAPPPAVNLQGIRGSTLAESLNRAYVEPEQDLHDSYDHAPPSKMVALEAWRPVYKQPRKTIAEGYADMKASQDRGYYDRALPSKMSFADCKKSTKTIANSIEAYKGYVDAMTVSKAASQSSVVILEYKADPNTWYDAAAKDATKHDYETDANNILDRIRNRKPK